jgi:HEAT repeat protein
MRPLRAIVEHYLREWDSSGWAGAYHSLIEIGPAIVPEITAHFEESGHPRFRAALVELSSRLRSDEALSLFALALEDEEPVVWKQALDALVTLASPSALDVLQAALTRDPPGGTDPGEWRAWVDEAIGQVRATLQARGGAA